MDNLTRRLMPNDPLKAASQLSSVTSFMEFQLISKQLSEVLESFGVQPIPAVGERFDPHIHEAVVTEPSDEHEPDTVVEELARGYRIGDRLLRPAMVKVASPKSGN
jgi:molecular chaperone GrpE